MNGPYLYEIHGGRVTVFAPEGEILAETHVDKLPLAIRALKAVERMPAPPVDPRDAHIVLGQDEIRAFLSRAEVPDVIEALRAAIAELTGERPTEAA